MPVLLMPALWVGGAAIILGGSYYMLQVFHGSSRATPMTTSAQKAKISKVMREHKRGTLKSSSGRRVQSRKQAVAIAMSESGQSRNRKKAS